MLIREVINLFTLLVRFSFIPIYDRLWRRGWDPMRHSVWKTNEHYRIYSPPALQAVVNGCTHRLTLIFHRVFPHWIYRSWHEFTLNSAQDSRITHRYTQRYTPIFSLFKRWWILRVFLSLRFYCVKLSNSRRAFFCDKQFKATQHDIARPHRRILA